MRVNRGILAGLGVVVLWASAVPAIQVAAPALGAVGLSFVRLAVASTALVIFACVARIRLPRMRDLGWIVAAGFFGMTAYQLLLNESELCVNASTASIIVAAAPLMSVAMARVLFSERVHPVTVVGSVIALGGVAVVCLSRAFLWSVACGLRWRPWSLRASTIRCSGRCCAPVPVSRSRRTRCLPVR